MLTKGMRSYITHTDPKLHDAFKAAAKQGAVRLSMQEALEVGMLTFLAERGILKTAQEALSMGAHVKAAVVFGKMVNGEAW